MGIPSNPRRTFSKKNPTARKTPSSTAKNVSTKTNKNTAAPATNTNSTKSYSKPNKQNKKWKKNSKKNTTVKSKSYASKRLLNGNWLIGRFWRFRGNRKPWLLREKLSERLLRN